MRMGSKRKSGREQPKINFTIEENFLLSKLMITTEGKTKEEVDQEITVRLFQQMIVSKKKEPIPDLEADIPPPRKRKSV